MEGKLEITANGIYEIQFDTIYRVADAVVYATGIGPAIVDMVVDDVPVFNSPLIDGQTVLALGIGAKLTLNVTDYATPITITYYPYTTYRG